MSSCAKSPNVAAQPLGRPDLSLALYLAALAAAVGLYLPLGALGAATDWWRMDESYTWSMVQLGLGGIIRRTAGDVHPPLYYLLLAPWVRVWHEPAVMQLFSLAAGLGALLAIAWTGCLLRGRRLGVLAVLLWATFPMFLHYCQDGRMYSLALLFETLAFAGWALAGRRPRAGWVLTVAALTASVYTHNLCLIFTAALLGCELARVLLARRRAAPGARRRGGLAWVVAAGLAVALLYAPWAVVLRHQLQNVSVRHGFHPPLWGDVAQAFLFHDYTLGFTTPDHGWAWLPGGLLMALLPLAGVLRPAGRPRAEAGRPVAMVMGVALGALGSILLFSRTIKPIFEAQRNEVLFLPFLLFASAAWFEARAGRLLPRLLALAAVIAGAAFSLAALDRPRDADLNPARDLVTELAPLDSPIFIYPAVPGFAALPWHPLALYDYGPDRPIPDSLTRCTLVVLLGGGPYREEIKRQAGLAFALAASVREIRTTYAMAIYQLRGLPPKALSNLLTQMPGMGTVPLAQQTGLRWIPSAVWPAGALAAMLRPAGQVQAFSPANPDWRGVRLAGMTNTLNLPALGPQKVAFGALLLVGDYLSPGTTATLRSRLGSGPETATELAGNEFLIAHLAPAASVLPPLTLQIPPALARPAARPANVPPGVYLTVGGVASAGPRRFPAPRHARPLL